MNTIFGMGCIFLGWGGVWWKLVAEQRRRLEAMTQLVGALQQITGEITGYAKPLPRILNDLAQSRTGQVGACFQGVMACFTQGDTLEESWAQGVKQGGFHGVSRDILLELGHQLQGTEETICKGIELACVQLTRILEEERQQATNRQRRTTALCFSAASLVVILLM